MLKREKQRSAHLNYEMRGQDRRACSPKMMHFRGPLFPKNDAFFGPPARVGRIRDIFFFPILPSPKATILPARFVRIFVIFHFLFIGSALFADPVGNPALPSLLQEGFFVPDTSWSNPQIGFTGDLLLSKRLFTKTSNKGSIQGTDEMAFFSWNLFERLMIQGGAGSGQFRWKWREGVQNLSGRVSGGILWSASGKLVLLEMKETVFSLAGSLGGWGEMRGPTNQNGQPLPGNSHAKMSYWQAAAALTQKIGLFSPYIGVAVNQTSLSVQQLSFQSFHPFGFFGGCSLSTGSRLLLNLEWRALYEEGISLSGQIRF